MSNMSRRTRMRERKAKSADERPVLTADRTHSVWNSVRVMARSVHKDIVMVISTAIATPFPALAPV